jgi:hypothetical protein
MINDILEPVVYSETYVLFPKAVSTFSIREERQPMRCKLYQGGQPTDPSQEI